MTSDTTLRTALDPTFLELEGFLAFMEITEVI